MPCLAASWYACRKRSIEDIRSWRKNLKLPIDHLMDPVHSPQKERKKAARPGGGNQDRQDEDMATPREKRLGGPAAGWPQHALLFVTVPDS